MSGLFRRLPAPAQEILMSAYGWAQYRNRYTGRLPSPYAELFDRPSAAPEWVAARQRERFSTLIRHAAAHVPYYRQLFSRLGITSDDITLENFTTILPVLTKDTLRSRNKDLHSERHQHGGTVLFTSGTSGTPLHVLADSDARRINYAYFRRLLQDNGSDVRARSATFAGRLFTRPDERKHMWRRDLFTRTLYCSSYHLTEETIPLYIRALEQWQPEYIDSYPSAISCLAGFMVRNHINHSIRPKFVLTSSETLQQEAREHIQQAFGCRVVDHYGCTELAVAARSQPDGGYTFDPLYSLVEFSPTGTDGETELIVTGLVNLGMPLIRYAIGDVVRGGWRKDDWRAGFSSLTGRQEDVVLTPEGRAIGRLDPAFKGVDGIVRSQIVQDEVHRIEVRVVPAPGSDMERIRKVLTENLRSRTSQSMTIDVIEVVDIPLTRSGKLKAVISRVGKV
ncbi:MAG: phenylacetate--CoA ligase family protein [Pseudomonadota bacterium]|nr:phenylacetate--CoA ligase family protein [Pseudomonadota bacterium]